MIRLYININNKCNTNCEFCCMYSGTNKNTFLSFERFKEILDCRNDDFELQLEGGEPLLNKNLYLFMWYAFYTNRCKKIIISTNGKILNEHLNRLTNFNKESKIPMTIKISLNYWLYNEDKDIFSKARDYYLATEFLESFDVKFNVRLRENDNWIVDRLNAFKIFEQSNIYEFQSYGKYSNTKYDKPKIVQNIDDWFLYSSDGLCFNKNLVTRSEHERSNK